MPEEQAGLKDVEEIAVMTHGEKLICGICEQEISGYCDQVFTLAAYPKLAAPGVYVAMCAGCSPRLVAELA